LNKVRVWDLPTRLFHWSLVVCFVGLVATGEVAGDAMVWHFRLGYAALSLLAFRLIWGVVGGYWSRFTSFVKGPVTIRNYLRGEALPEHGVGHNPLGALSVLGLLFSALLQIAAGLCSDDEIATSGPLVKMVASEWVSRATWYHTNIGKAILIALVLLHLAAIAFYRFRGENLVAPMVHGDKLLAVEVPASRDSIATRILALLVLGVCAAAVAGLLQWAG